MALKPRRTTQTSVDEILEWQKTEWRVYSRALNRHNAKNCCFYIRCDGCYRILSEQGPTPKHDVVAYEGFDLPAAVEVWNRLVD